MTNKPLVAPASAVVFVTTLLVSSILLADGYRNPPEGARAIGAFGGHRAFADDANATIHNSANLVDLKQPMVQANTTFGYGTTSFERAGVSDKTEHPFFAIPGFSSAIPFQDGKYAVGLATYVPYGRSVAWDRNDFFGQNNVSYAGSMMVADFTPNVAARLTDSVSVGAGLDLYYGEVEQKTRLQGLSGAPYFIPENTVSKLTADGTAVGWNTSIAWKMTKRQRLVATYRAPFAINYKGHNDLSSGGQSDVDAEIEYPSIVGLAYGIQLTDTLKAEINGEWLQFSQYETLRINDTDPRFATTSEQNLKDTWTAGTGLAWNFKPQWTLRSGFMYLKNPTPESTYGPLGPDENQGVISFGLGYENEHHTVDLGYAYGLFNGRTINETQDPYGRYNGDYDYNVHLLALSYGYKF